MRAFRFSVATALVAFAVVLVGAHPAAAGEGLAVVQGKVTLRGKPLAKGRILFHLKNDQMVGAKIKDGAYSVERVPVGAWAVTVEGEGVSPKFSSDEKTVLKVEIKGGKNDVNLELDSPSPK